MDGAWNFGPIRVGRNWKAKVLINGCRPRPQASKSDAQLASTQDPHPADGLTFSPWLSQPVGPCDPTPHGCAETTADGRGRLR